MLTNAGRDLHAAAVYSTGAQPAAANYIGVTANNGAPGAGDTTLTGEIATAGGGLVRSQGAYAHTGGTNQVTVTEALVANANDVLPVTLAKAGLFNAGAAGTMAHESLLNATATLTAPGDEVTVQFVIDIDDAS
jgi:hypothetical protein